MNLKAGVASSITLPVINLNGTGLKLVGDVYVLLYDKAQDKYFSTDGGGTWETRASATFPTATLVTGGEWYYYEIPAAATAGLADHTRLSLVMVDSTTPATVAALSPTVLLEVLTSWPAEASDVAPAGLFAITLHTHTAGGVSVSDMTVAVYDSGLTNLLDRQVTDSSGNIVTHLNNGTYKVRTSKGGYTTSTATIVVTADATEIIVVTPLPVPAAASPDMCTVYGYLLDGNGNEINGETLTFYGYTPAGVGSNIIATTALVVITGPSIINPAWPAGYFETDLLREAEFKVFNRTTKLDNLVITVPDAASALLATLVEEAKS